MVCLWKQCLPVSTLCTWTHEASVCVWLGEPNPVGWAPVRGEGPVSRWCTQSRVPTNVPLQSSPCGAYYDSSASYLPSNAFSYMLSLCPVPCVTTCHPSLLALSPLCSPLPYASPSASASTYLFGGGGGGISLCKFMRITSGVFSVWDNRSDWPPVLGRGGASCRTIRIAIHSKHNLSWFVIWWVHNKLYMSHFFDNHTAS